jgi:hypothetical protein
MDLNFNFKLTLDRELLNAINNIGNKMATLQDIKNELAGITDAVAAQKTSFDLLVTEVRQLLVQGDIVGADNLLAEIQADKEAIMAAVALNTSLAAEVDAINGDPVVV